MRSGHAQCLGTVAFVAARWGVLDRLARAATLTDAYEETLAATVEVSRRAKTRAGAAYSQQRRIVLNRELLHPGRDAPTATRSSCTNARICSPISITAAIAGTAPRGDRSCGSWASRQKFATTSITCRVAAMPW